MEDHHGESDSDVTVLGSPPFCSYLDSPCLMSQEAQFFRVAQPIASDVDSDQETFVLSLPSPSPSMASVLPQKEVSKSPERVTSLSSDEVSCFPDPSTGWNERLSKMVPTAITPKKASINTHNGSPCAQSSHTTCKDVHGLSPSIISSKSPAYCPIDVTRTRSPLVLSPASQLCVLSQIGDLGQSASPQMLQSGVCEPMWRRGHKRSAQMSMERLEHNPQPVRRSNNVFGKKLISIAADWDSCSEKIFDGETSNGEEWAFDNCSDSDFD